MDSMTTLQDIETAIDKLTPEEFEELRRWIDTRTQLIDLQGKTVLEPELNARLDRLAKETGRTKSDYARQAIEEFLEDREDYLLGITSLEQQQSRIPLSTLRKELGLER